MLALFLVALLAPQAGAVSTPRAMVGPPPRPAASAVSRTNGIEVAAAGGVLWQGELRVGRDQASSFTMNKAESGWYAACPQAQRPGSARSGLELSLTSLGQTRVDEYVRVRVSWQRLTGETGCLSESGTRTVGLDATAAFDGGNAIELRGDAGLRVRVTRR
jgi:hypothetical protein